MSDKPKIIVSLGAALAALTGASVQGIQAKTAATADVTVTAGNPESQVVPNAHFQAGEDLLGFTMTRQADGTLVAQHASHASHASHTSHASSR